MRRPRSLPPPAAKGRGVTTARPARPASPGRRGPPSPGRQGVPPPGRQGSSSENGPSPLWILGPHAVAAQLQSQPDLVERLLVGAHAGERALALAREAELLGLRAEAAGPAQLEAIASGRPHQGIAAAVREVPLTALPILLGRQPRLLVALDGICDPHNLGAIMRSAWALGAEGILLPERRSAPLGAAAVRSAAGAHAHLPICRVVNLSRALSACKEAGLWVVGTAASAPQALADLDLPERLVLVVGGEGRGVRPAVAASCDFTGAILQRPGSGSLNASVACGIALYAIGALRRETK